MSQILQLLSPIQNVLEIIIVWLYQNVIANYGIVIILLTIIVRLILTPLTITQTRSMARMQKIQPQLKELQKKYKDDKQKLQQETMDFYKQNNVNPLAGCLPLLLQMPVFFALFQALRNPTEKVTDVVKDFDFLWLNLNERDPYYILVILMVATMFLSTKLSTTDPKQSKIMYILPVVFGFISWQFPAGILVYWVTTNVWSIGQQWIVNRIVKRGIGKEGKKEEEKVVLSQEEITTIARKKKKRRKNK
ncbi:YidC/Oxa1 family membrane protein insertase [Actinomycetota bacterium]